jgi:hypothetical protein
VFEAGDIERFRVEVERLQRAAVRLDRPHDPPSPDTAATTVEPPSRLDGPASD